MTCMYTAWGDIVCNNQNSMPDVTEHYRNSGSTYRLKFGVSTANNVVEQRRINNRENLVPVEKKRYNNQFTENDSSASIMSVCSARCEKKREHWDIRKGRLLFNNVYDCECHTARECYKIGWRYCA